MLVGTGGVSLARSASRMIYACSLAVASGRAAPVPKGRRRILAIFGMGLEGRMRTDEDEVSALYAIGVEREDGLLFAYTEAVR